MYKMFLKNDECIQHYVLLLNAKEAFDNVRHAQLFQDLGEIGLDTKDLLLLSELYWKQSAAIRIEGNFGRSIRIMKGERQGCVTSPDFFNLYVEKILSHLEEYEGISVGGRNLNNLRYADDTTLMADSECKLQRLLDVVVQQSGNRGLKVNIKKTFSMVISKRPTEVLDFHQREGGPASRVFFVSGQPYYK